MEPIANYNPPVCCWNCEHYQRYDSDSRPKRCDGECRLNPVPGALFTTDFSPDPQDKDDFGHNKETSYYWPHITCGLRMRCASFEKSTENSLPQSPLSFDCQHTAPTVTAEWKPWIKPGKKSCFTCSWFEPELCQRKHDRQIDRGCCLHGPPPPRQFHVFEQMLPRAEIGATPSILGALGLWCSKWEGPRPEIGFTTEDLQDPIESPLDVYTQWEARRERLVWLASIQLAKVKEQIAKSRAHAEKRIITLDRVRKPK